MNQITVSSGSGFVDITQENVGYDPDTVRVTLEQLEGVLRMIDECGRVAMEVFLMEIEHLQEEFTVQPKPHRGVMTDEPVQEMPVASTPVYVKGDCS